jgi:hypothetical protein
MADAQRKGGSDRKAKEGGAKGDEPAAKKPRVEPRTEQVDLRKRNLTLMLVKVPDYLMAEWEEKRLGAAGGVARLGKLVIDQGKRAANGKGPAMHLLCEELSEDKPSRYDLRQSAEYPKVADPDKPGILIVSENSKGETKVPVVEGVVSTSFDVKPDGKDPKYIAIQREKVKQIAIDRAGKAKDYARGEGGAGMVMPVRVKSKPTRAPRADMNVRKPIEQVQQILMVLFQEKPRWTMKELHERCKQPLTWLREILEDLCATPVPSHARTGTEDPCAMPVLFKRSAGTMHGRIGRVGVLCTCCAVWPDAVRHSVWARA